MGARLGVAAAAIASNLLLLLVARPAPSDASREAQGFPVAIEREVFEAVNRYRSSQGLSPLSHSAEIEEIARRHSAAMARGEVPFGHDGMGARFEALARRVGAKRLAENLSRHQRPPEEIPGAAVSGWLESRRHRENIRGRYDRTGVGAARDAEGVVYLTQIFTAS